MADFTAKDVQALRMASGAGMMDAKRALQENDGDAEAASRWLREKGLVKSGDRRDRVNAQGAVAVGRTDGSASAVEVKCETDYVAKSEQFTAFANELAAAVAAEGPGAAEGLAVRLDDLRLTLKENIELGRIAHFQAGDTSLIDTYLHTQNGRGVNAVMVELTGGSMSQAHDVALHVASMRPRWLSRDDVPPERVADEKALIETLTRNEGKPEAAVPKIVEGRIGGWLRDTCLLEQPFVKDSKVSVAQFLGDARLVRFAQVEIGGSSGG